MTNFMRGFLAGLLALTMGSASATLLNRGPDMVYDDVLNVTFVRNVSLCVTLNNCVNRFDDPRTGVIGGMRWNDANTWVENLDFGGYSDWRLPWVSVSAGLGSLVTNPVNCNSATELECRDVEEGKCVTAAFASFPSNDP